MANKYTLKTSVTSHLQISILEIAKWIENKCMNGHNTHSLEAEDNIILIVRHEAASVV